MNIWVPGPLVASPTSQQPLHGPTSTICSAPLGAGQKKTKSKDPYGHLLTNPLFSGCDVNPLLKKEVCNRKTWISNP